jgi:serine/threonine protein kinase
MVQDYSYGNQSTQREEIMIRYLQTGCKLAKDRYIFQEQLGEGGFGITFLAKDTRNGRLVVIKTPNKAMRRDANFIYFRDKFSNEAVKLGQCNHPHIVKLMDEIIYDEFEFPYLVMEYIPGLNLQDYILSQRNFLSQEEALLYIRQIADALKVVHQMSLFHLDVNPRNIIIRNDKKEAVLIDFGTSRRADADLKSVINQFISRSYAPIERYRLKEQGAYTDVYGLSATLYFMLTGIGPVEADTRGNLIKQGRIDPLRPPNEYGSNIDVNVNDTILWGMAFEPKDRPQSIQEWLDKLLLPSSFVEIKPSSHYSQQLNPIRDSVKKINITKSLLESLLTSSIYGLLICSLPLMATTNLKILIVSGSIGLLALTGLIFAQYYNWFNLLNRKVVKYTTFALAIFALSMLLWRSPDLLLITIILVLFNSWGLLCMGILIYLFPKNESYINF